MIDFSNYSCGACAREFSRHCKHCIHTADKTPTKFKLKKIPPLFPSHKVTIKEHDFYSSVLNPYYALNCLLNNNPNLMVTVLKQRRKSLTIAIHCRNDVYEQIKLNFIRELGGTFLWKD